jgi:hypothetical protein
MPAMSDFFSSGQRERGNTMKTKCLLIAANLLLTVNAYAGDYKVTCNLPNNKMCSEDTLSSESARDNLADRCQKGGGNVLSGSCSPGPSCTFLDSGDTRKVYDYSMPAESYKLNCKLQGGKYSG